MIGLVVVSHSRPLARAVIALATELLPAQAVRIEMAAGSYENALGTDAEAVAQAITAADTGEGVLVLMDLGSAILSAETAVELLETPVRVRLCAAPLVEGLVAALASAGGGADLDEVAYEADNALAAKRTQLGESHSRTEPGAATASTSDTQRTTAILEVTNTHGLHARPAAELVAALRTLNAEIQLRNASTGAGPVPGNSLTSVLTLGVRPGQLLEVTVSGPDAATAIASTRALITER